MRLNDVERKRCLAIFLVTIVGASACANSGSTASILDPIDSETRISVLLNREGIAFSDEDATDGRAASGAKEGGRGAAEGAAAGATIGAAISLFCGSFFSSCATVLVPPMAASGAVSGSATGVLEGVMIELEPDEVAALNDALTVIDISDVQESLRSEFLSQGKNIWNISEQDSSIKITLGIDSIFFSQLDKDTLLLNTRTEMQVSPVSGRQRSRHKHVYSHTSGSKSVQEWFENDGAKIQSEIRVGVEKTVSQMVMALRPLRTTR